MAYNIPSALLETVRREWEAAPHTMKQDVLKRHAAVIGCSTHCLYGRMRKAHGRMKSVRREEVVPDYVIDMAEDICERAFAFGDRRPSAHRIVEKLARRGVPEDHLPSPSTINRRMQIRGFGARRRYRKVEAGYALQRVMLDFSRSECFQLDTKDKGMLRCTAGSFAYKDNNKALRSWIVSVIDDHSRMTHAKLYPATSESGLLGLKFLMDFFDAQDNGEHPDQRHFRHAPQLLQTDHGAFRREQSVGLALACCDIDLKGATKESQGKVERQFRTLWTDFEIVLAEDLGKGARISIEDYNALLRAWCIERGRAEHPSQPKRTREEVYLASLRMHPPRILTDDLLQLAFRVKTPTVNNYGHVKLDGAEYVTPDFCLDDEGSQIAVVPGMKIEVLRNRRGEVLGKLVDRYSEYFKLTPFQQQEYGDFAHGPQPARRDEVARRIDARESGQDAAWRSLPAAVNAAPQSAIRNLQSGAAVIRTLPHKATEIEPDSPFLAGPPAERLTAFQAKLYVARRMEAFGLTYADVSEYFDPYVGSGIDRPDLDAQIDRLLQQAKSAM